MPGESDFTPETYSDAETAPEQLDGPTQRHGAPQGGSEEAPVGVWDAVRSHLAIVIITIIVFAAAGAAVAYVRHQKYSATARLAVLHLNLGAPGALSGLATGGPVLADTYARAITADGVIDPVAARLHVRPATLRAELAAAAVPQSPVFAVTATTPSSATAIALANAASAQLIRYVQRVNSSNPEAAKLLKALSKAQLRVNVLVANKDALQSAISSSLAHKGATTAKMSLAQRKQLASAEADLSVAVDQANSIRAAYQQSFEGTAATQSLQPLAAASSAAGDRRSRLELLVFAGAAAGLGLGVALALLLAARRTRTRPSS